VVERRDQQARIDIGTKRKADLYDIRERRKFKGLIRQYGDRWNVAWFGAERKRKSPAAF